MVFYESHEDNCNDNIYYEIMFCNDVNLYYLARLYLALSLMEQHLMLVPQYLEKFNYQCVYFALIYMVISM